MSMFNRIVGMGSKLNKSADTVLSLKTMAGAVWAGGWGLAKGDPLGNVHNYVSKVTEAKHARAFGYARGVAAKAGRELKMTGRVAAAQRDATFLAGAGYAGVGLAGLSAYKRLGSDDTSTNLGFAAGFGYKAFRGKGFKSSLGAGIVGGVAGRILF